MDKGYNSYIPMAQWTIRNVTWVTRLNTRACCQVLEDLPVSEKFKNNGVISDKLIIPGNRYRKAKVPLQEARIVVYYSPFFFKKIISCANEGIIKAPSI